jgi:hypothetical protein
MQQVLQTRANYTKELWDLTQVYNILDPARLRGGFSTIVERDRTTTSAQLKQNNNVYIMS